MGGSPNGRVPLQVRLLAAVVLLALATAAGYALRSRARANDFAHYYVSSRVWLEDRDPYRSLFAEEFQKYGFTYDPRIPTATNPPPLIIAFAPFALLRPDFAFYGWMVVQIFSLGATFLAIHKLVSDRLATPTFTLVAFALLFCTATYDHFWYSQVQLQLGALLVLAYVKQQQGDYQNSWLLVSMAACLKLIPALILPWLVWSAPGRMRTKVRWLAPSAILVAMIVALNWPLWRGFFGSSVDVVQSNVANRMFNYSLPALLVNLASSIDVFSSSASPDRIWIFGLASGAVLTAAAYVAVWRSGCSNRTAFCVLLLVTIVAGPTAWAHYFVLAYLPFAMFAGAVLYRPSPSHLVSLAIVYLGMMNVVRFDRLTGNPTAKVLISCLPLYIALALIVWFLKTDGGGRAAHNQGFRTESRTKVPALARSRVK